jgi:hypothetical protein
MDLEHAVAVSTKVAVTTATGMTLFGMTVGDIGVGVVGVTTLVLTAFINLYTKFREEQRVQLSKDLELSKQSWKSRFMRAHEENEALKDLVDAHKEEISILRQRIRDISSKRRAKGEHDQNNLVEG